VLAMQTIKDEFDSAHDLSLDLYYEYFDLNRKDDLEHIIRMILGRDGIPELVRTECRD
jgi:hypothetical protein